MRLSLRLAAAAAVVAIVVGPASALRVAFLPPAQRAITSDTVVVGKVTGFEKDLVMVEPAPGVKEKVGYKVAIVKIDSGLIGADKMTEVKVGFIPPPKIDPNVKQPGGGIRPVPIGPRRDFGTELKEGQEMIFFLAKHPSGGFYIMPGMTPPVDVKDETGKKEIENIKKIATVLADPMKGLKSEKPEVRGETAAIMVMKYRAYPPFGGEVDQVAISADESKLILKGLTEADWSNNPRLGGQQGFNAMQAFYSLGLTNKDGWVPPVIAPGGPPVDFNAVQKDAFTKWLAGPGKDYVVRRVVPKKAVEK